MFHVVIATAVSLISAGDADVRIDRLRGDPISGQLVRFEDRALVLSENGAEVLIQYAEIESVRLTDENLAVPSARPKDAVGVELRDGSRLVAQRLEAKTDAISVTLPEDLRLSIATSLVRLVRFRAPLEELHKQWNEIISRKLTADLLVIRRPGPVLDYVDGAVGEITDESVIFAVDGEKVSVGRERLEGFLYFSAAPPPAAQSVCTVYDRHGNQLQATRLTLDSPGVLKVLLASGVELTLRVSDLARMDFGSRNVVYLSDLKPSRVQWSPYLPVPVDAKKLARLYLPRMNESFDGRRLRLAENASGSRYIEFDKGLAIQSRTEIIYRLPSGFQRLVGAAGMSPDVSGGRVALAISGDGIVIHQQEIASGTGPHSIDLNITDVRRLTIVVDFADDSAFADQVNLCNFRLTK